MERKTGVLFPRSYRKFLLSYGKDSINTRHNQINNPPEEIFISYEAIEEALEEWKEEFEEAQKNGRQGDYIDNDYF